MMPAVYIARNWHAGLLEVDGIDYGKAIEYDVLQIVNRSILAQRNETRDRLERERSQHERSQHEQSQHEQSASAEATSNTDDGKRDDATAMETP